MTEKSKFGPEKNGFDREEFNKNLIGKIVMVYGMTPGVCIKGILKHYIEHDLAILQPYVIYDKNGTPKVIDKPTKVDNPNTISELDCDTLEKFIEEYIPINKKDEE